MNLYEIEEDFRRVEEILIESDGELTPELEAELDRLEVQLEEKIGGYVHVIRNFEAEEKACRDEASRFSKRASARGNAARRLKFRILQALQARDIKRMGRVRRQGSAPSVTIIDPAEVPIDFVVESEPCLDKRAILAYWKETGEEPRGTKVVKGEHVRIS